MSGSATSKKIVAGHSKADEKQEESHGITENESKAAFFDPSLVEMVSMTKSQFKPDLRRQPKVSEHRGTHVGKSRVSHYVPVAEVKAPPSDTSEKRPTVLEKRFSRERGESIRRESQDSHESRDKLKKKAERTSFDSTETASAGKPDEEDGAWDIFMDDYQDDDDDDLLETNPLYEMANVDIDVEDALIEMEEILAHSLEEARVSDRERTVLLDKFGLFLQALVSFQENEVELIDHIGMKAQIIDVLQVFIVDEHKATSFLVAEKDVKDETNGMGILESLSLVKLEEGGGTEEDGVKRDADGRALDEMGATTVRENLLIQKNKLEMQEQMKMIHLLEIKQLEFEKTLLTMHYGKMIKPTDLQKEMRDLRKTITDMKIEIGSIQQEISQLQLDIEAEEKSLREEEAIVNQLDLDTLSKQIEVTLNSAKPLHMSKDADREANKLEQFQDVLQDLEERWMAGMEKYRIFQGKIDVKSSEYETLLKEEARIVTAKKQAQTETDRLLVDIETFQKKEAALLNKSRMVIERITFNVKLKKKLYEEHHMIYNQTTRAQREYQKLERTTKVAHDAHLNAKLAYEKMRSAFDSTQPKGDSENWDKLRKMFLHEIEHLKRSLDKKMAESTYGAIAVAELQQKLNGLYEEQIKCGKDLQNLMRMTVRKRRERQDKSEQCVKLAAQLFSIMTDIRVKKLTLDECTRNERELNRSMILVQKQYSQIKIERSAVLGDLIQAKQRVVEQSEKFKIANNEVESYVNQSLDRQREITRIHYLLLNAGLARDSVRNDALRCVGKFRFHRIERDELKMANENTRKEISRLRGDVVDIRKRFEAAIEGSAKVAAGLRERTEEVCTFIERQKAYDMILLKGTAELRLREMERSKLMSALTEAKTHLFIVTANEPDENKYIEIIEKLRAQLYEVTKERRNLEDELSNITRPGRVREINHNWIAEREQVPLLRKKIFKLEGLLATREVRILERELTLKRVEELTEGSMENAAYLKTKYECEVKYLVGMRKNLYHLSNRIDGLICENSLAASRSAKAESEYMREKQKFLKAERRFELGYPPTRQFENEWNHKVWQEKMLGRARTRPPGFLVQKKRLTGSRLVMERLRPRRKHCEEDYYQYGSPPIPIKEAPVLRGKCCPRFPYKPTHRKLSCVKPVVSKLSTGVRLSPCS